MCIEYSVSFLDEVVRKETAFESIVDMCDHSMGSYVPTLRADINSDLILVANAFNAEMRARNKCDKKAYLCGENGSRFVECTRCCNLVNERKALRDKNNNPYCSETCKEEYGMWDDYEG